MTAGLRWAMNLAAGLLMLGSLALGGAWLLDRAHRWEQPAWRPQAFVRLRGAPGVEGGEQACWVMAVNPRCGHCLATLRRTNTAWSRRGWRPELTVLIVDTSRPPGTSTLAAIPASQIWWDAAGIWRRRWGHRLYGELLQFDAAGRWARTLSADDLLRRRLLPSPLDDSLPRPFTHGGRGS